MARNLKIYYVEDDKILSELERLLLERLGYRIVGCADNAQQAIAGIQKTTPDLVLVDIELHGKQDGFSIGDFLAKAMIPFIYVSAHHDEGVLEKAKKTEPDGFLTKPFNDSQLRVAIEMASRK